MADPTDRQRAEAKALECLPVAIFGEDETMMIAHIEVAKALLSFRREGWDAGREAAATTIDDLGVEAGLGDVIRALLPPEAPAAQDASDKEEK